MKYTQQGEKFDKLVDEYLNIVCGVLKNKISGLKSIILAGGFGRGEGGLEKRGDRYIPVNDFEIYLVVEKKPSEDLLNDVANEASKKLDFKKTGVPFYTFSREEYADTFYIDLKALTPKDLTTLLPMFRYYELKHAGTLLWGENLLDLIPDFKLDDIPLAEGFRILLNRLAMVSHYFSLGFLKREMSPEEKHGFLYIASKTLVDIPTALLQLNGKFVPSYLGRQEVLRDCYREDFPELYKRIPDLPEVVKAATSFKLNPDFSRQFDQFKTFKKYRHYCGEATKYFVSQMLDKKIESYEVLAEKIYDEIWRLYYPPYIKYRYPNFITRWDKVPGLVMPFLNLIYFSRLYSFRRIFYPRILLNKRGPDLTIFSSLVCLIYSVRENGSVDSDMLQKAAYYLRRTYPYRMKSSDYTKEWDLLSDSLSNAYVLFFFLKIV